MFVILSTMRILLDTVEIALRVMRDIVGNSLGLGMRIR